MTNDVHSHVDDAAAERGGTRVINHSRGGAAESRKVAKNESSLSSHWRLTLERAPKLGSEMGQLGLRSSLENVGRRRPSVMGRPLSPEIN